MGHTNQTTNYHLPQFIGSDKPGWLTDFNSGMSAIDTAIKNAADAASAASTAASNAASVAGTANTKATNAQSAATAAQNTANANSSAITSLQGRVGSLESAVGTLRSARHITNVRTSGSWQIEEYSDGYVRQLYNGVVTFTNASSAFNGWHRSVQNVSLPVTVHQTNSTCYGSGAAAGRLLVVTGLSGQTAVECQLLSGQSFAGGLSVSNANIVVEGYAV